MANGIRTGDPCEFNKGRSSNFHVGSRVQQTPEEGQRTYRPKRCGNNNKDEDNSPKTLNDKFFFLYPNSVQPGTYKAIKNLKVLIGRTLWYNFRMFLHLPFLSTHSWNLPQAIKNIDISLGVYSFEK